MPYIQDGGVVQSRTLWRLSLIPELFWALVNFVFMFFHTLVSSGATDAYLGKKPSTVRGFGSGGGGSGGGGGGGGAPPRVPPGTKRPMGGFGGRDFRTNCPPGMAGGS